MFRETRMEPMITIQELPRGLGRKVERVCKVWTYGIIGVCLLISVLMLAVSAFIYLMSAVEIEGFQTALTEAEQIAAKEGAVVFLSLAPVVALVGAVFGGWSWVTSRIGTILRYLEAMVHAEIAQSLPRGLGARVKRVCTAMIGLSLVLGAAGAFFLSERTFEASPGTFVTQKSVLYGAVMGMSGVMSAVLFWMAARIGPILNHVERMALAGDQPTGNNSVADSRGFLAPATQFAAATQTAMAVGVQRLPQGQGSAVERVGTWSIYLWLALGILLGVDLGVDDAGDDAIWMRMLLLVGGIVFGAVFALLSWAYARIGTVLNYVEAMAQTRAGRLGQTVTGVDPQTGSSGPGTVVERVGKICVYVALFLAVIEVGEFSGVVVETSTGAFVYETRWLQVLLSLVGGIMSAVAFWMTARIGTILNVVSAMANAATARPSGDRAGFADGGFFRQ